MFSKIVILAVVAISMAAVVQSADPPKKDAASGAQSVEVEKGGKNGTCWRKVKECCPSLAITKKGAWKECNETAGVVCKSDCVFDKSGLLSADKKSIDLAAVNNALDKMTTFDKAVIADAKAKCTASAPQQNDNQKKCVTGGHALHACLMKVLAPKCPDTLTEECKKTINDAVDKAEKRDQMKMEKKKAAEEKKSAKSAKKN